MSKLQEEMKVFSDCESSAGRQEIGKSGTGCSVRDVAKGRRTLGVQLVALLVVLIASLPLAAQTPPGFTVIVHQESVLVAFETSDGLVSGTVSEDAGFEGYHQLILFLTDNNDASLLVKGSGSGTASQGSGSGTASQGSGSGTASQGSGSGTASQGSGSGTASQGSGSGTASQGSGSGTASQGSGSGTASECDDFGILVKGSGSGTASDCPFDHPSAWGIAEVVVHDDGVYVTIHQVNDGVAVEFATTEL